MNRNFQHKIVNIFLPIILRICFGCSKEPSHSDGSFEYLQHIFGCSKEPSHWDGSFEYPQHIFCLRNKKIIFPEVHLSKSPQDPHCDFSF